MEERVRGATAARQVHGLFRRCNGRETLGLGRAAEIEIRRLPSSSNAMAR